MGAEIVPLAAAVFPVALLHSSAGHAGASGCIAVMTLFGFVLWFSAWRPVFCRRDGSRSCRPRCC